MPGATSEHGEAPGPKAPQPALSEPLGRVVELARDVLRERGLTEDQIETLLTRPKPPDDLP
jgi:hypothetical protein